MRWRDFDDLPPLHPEFFHISRRIHFIGIGGIGMSALAHVLASRGHVITGSDVNDGAAQARLREAGAVTAIGHSAANLDLDGAPCDAVIFSSAVAPDNPERQEALRRGIPLWHRAQLLAYFVNTAKFSIAVSGTHGKSTTSAMVAHILTECGHNPTAILGAVYPPFGSNARVGDPDVVVVEADESDGSFTLLHPTVSVILNVEAEHLENYDDSEARLWEAFKQFAAQAKEHVVLNRDDPGLLWRFADKRVWFYATHYKNDSADGDVDERELFLPATQASRIEPEVGRIIYHLFCAGYYNDIFETDYIGAVCLRMAGEHNVSNALAAISASRAAGVHPIEAAGFLTSFRGIGRRFECKGEAGGVLVYDDYGHHPTEVEKTLQAAKEFLGRRLVVIFQPHRYSRTQQLGAHFGPAFAAADEVIITQLYSAFEEPIPGVSGEIVSDAVKRALPDKPCVFAASLEDAKELALSRVREGDVIFTMGAGDVTRLGPQLLEALRSRE